MEEEYYFLNMRCVFYPTVVWVFDRLLAFQTHYWEILQSTEQQNKCSVKADIHEIFLYPFLCSSTLNIFYEQGPCSISSYLKAKGTWHHSLYVGSTSTKSLEKKTG